MCACWFGSILGRRGIGGLWPRECALSPSWTFRLKFESHCPSVFLFSGLALCLWLGHPG